VIYTLGGRFPRARAEPSTHRTC